MDLARVFPFRRRRQAPSAVVRGAPDGLVRLVGQLEVPESGAHRNAPFSGRPCVWYRVWIEELQRVGTGRQWIKVFEELDPRPFVLRDATGACLVAPTPAMSRLDSCQSAWDSISRPEALPEALRPAASARWLGRPLRFGEERIPPGPGHVQGRLVTAGPAGAPGHAERLLHVYRAWRTDYMARFGGDPARLHANPSPMPRDLYDPTRLAPASASWAGEAGFAGGTSRVLLLTGGSTQEYLVAAARPARRAPWRPRAQRAS